MDLVDRGCEDGKRMELAQDHVQWIVYSVIGIKHLVSGTGKLLICRISL